MQLRARPLRAWIDFLKERDMLLLTAPDEACWAIENSCPVGLASARG